MDPIDLHFPFAGVDVSGPVGRQPNRPVLDGKYARTAPRGVNVRGMDSGGRYRGGIRPGLTKYLDPRPGGVRWATQGLDKFVTSGTVAPGGQTVQPSQSGRIVSLVAVSKGNVYTVVAGGSAWVAATNGTTETPPLNATGLVRMAQNTQLMFFADGINRCYYDKEDNTVKPWVPTVGDFPVDDEGNTARLICTWRGRTVHAGFLKDPHWIAMSAISKPFDYDYDPDEPVPAGAAWEGHTGTQGLMGDDVTALIPYTDDQLIVGMDSSIAIFRGDPNYGGSIDNMTTTVGIAFGEAWCMDPNGIIYFFSNRTGIFQFVPGKQPQRMSMAIDSLLLGINTGEYGVRLIWNDRYQSLHVYVTLLASPLATTHYTWESQTNAWWQDTFTDPDMNPLCCCTFDGNEANDRVSLIGGFDGHVRSISSTATTDDGEAIESEVWIGPFLTKYGDEVDLREVQGVMGEDSDDVEYEVFVGETAEQALDSTAVASGTWSAGRNYTDAVRRAGHAAYLKITSVGAWAFESCRALIDTRGKVRQRGKA